MKNGFFITFEGGEGVGKTTQIQKLSDYLTANGRDVITTREPGGTKSAEEIRSLLSHKIYGGKWTPNAELMLLFAARSMHIKEIIAPALADGKIVLCDRYIDSTRVYQGYLQHIDMDFIFDLEKRIVGKYMPNLTLLLDISPQIAMGRVKNRGVGDHYDNGDLSFYTDLRNGFLELAAKEKERISIINSENSVEDIAQHIQKTVRGILSNVV